MRNRFNRAMFDLDARWIMSKVVIGLPIPGRPDRPWRKTTAAIRTDVGEHLIDAVLAERAFETADHGQIRFWRKRAIAILAGRAKFQHLICAPEVDVASVSASRAVRERSIIR